MKKVINAFTLIFVLSFCLTINVNAKEEEIFRSNDAHLIRSTNVNLISELNLSWSLLDGRTNEILTNINLTELGYNKENKKLNQTLLEQFVQDLAKKIEQPLILPSITRDGTIKEGQNKVTLEVQQLKDRMISLRYYNKQLRLPINEELPAFTAEDLKTIKDVLISSYTTYFDPNVHGRSINIKLSAEAIDHYVLASNEIFSFNKVVGKRTMEKGYQESLEIVNKEFVTGIGGGICQTSTTLYNVIDFAQLEIVEHHTHSQEIGYAPKGRDATVSWGGPDLQFKNPYPTPILISTTTDLKNGKIEIQLYGSAELEKMTVSN